MPANRPPAAPVPYLQTTVEATIYHVERDFVDMYWETPGGAKARGRLYQRDSYANGADAPLLEHNPRYEKNKRLRVYVDQAGDAKNHFHYHLHERWADDGNPWLKLNLYEDDVVCGKVIRAIVGHAGQIAWLVQLDAAASFPEDSDAGLQPDIIVFVPLTELPWDDGSTSERPAGDGASKRLQLLRGDDVLLRILKINPSPEYPRGSVLRLIHQRDAQSGGLTSSAPTPNLATRLKFKAPSANQVPSPLISSPLSLLAQRVIWLVDDDEKQMTLLAHRLEANGAKVRMFVLAFGNWDVVCGKTIAELEDALFGARLLNNPPPDVVLVDHQFRNQAHDGTQLVQRWREWAASNGKTPPLCVLISTWLPALNAEQQQCLFGALQRPLNLGSLLQVLHGKPVWEMRKQEETASLEFSMLPAATRNPAQWLGEFMKVTQAHFVVLLAAQGAQELSLLAHIGAVPFQAQQLSQVMDLSDLRLLVSGRLAELLLIPTDKNAWLKTTLAGHAFWVGLKDPQSKLTTPDWVLGLGWKSSVPANERRWMQRYAAEALIRMRQEENMNSLADLLGKGMRLDGMAHEWQRRQNHFVELVLTLTELRGLLGHDDQVPAEIATLLDESLPELSIAATELQHTASMLLGLQRGRHTAIDLLALMALLKPMAQASCLERDVQLVWPQHIPPLVLGLPATALSVPLLNLIDNAAKHHVRQENNRVVVEIALPTTGAHAGQLLITVTDNSFGLSVAQRGRLFAPMQSTAAEEERHGVGLWLSQQVITRLGGQIALAWSWRGIGTRFELILPLVLEGDLESNT